MGRSRNDTDGLIDGFVKFGIDLQHGAGVVEHQRIGRECCVGIAARRQLFCLIDVARVDQFGLNCLPQIRGSQCFDGSVTVGREFGLGDGNERGRTA